MVIGVIPARLSSVRFPEKILTPFLGKPMIAVVAEKALKANTLDEVIIAVDDSKTIQALKPYPYKTIMTSKNHTSGSDRIAETIQNIPVDIVVNIQGDEPMIEPEIIDKMVKEFDDPKVEMTTAVSTVLSSENMANPNSVKVKLDDQNNATMFVRELPTGDQIDWYHHVGIYAYRKETLSDFTTLPPSVNEKKLKLEQLRALDNGIKIKAVITDFAFRGVDTPEDLESLKQLLKTQKYDS